MTFELVDDVPVVFAPVITNANKREGGRSNVDDDVNSFVSIDGRGLVSLSIESGKGLELFHLHPEFSPSLFPGVTHF